LAALSRGGRQVRIAEGHPPLDLAGDKPERSFILTVASNKNQHFVPRCYLRPFTLDGGNKAINLHNLDRAKSFPGAAVKGQCSGDYFYGDDLFIEKALQSFEGLYASRLKAILTAGYQLVDVDRELLKEFWFLQYLRTKAASERAVAMHDQMDAELGGLPPSYKLEIRDAVSNAMKVFAKARNAVFDLKVTLVRNRSVAPFITSDNPAVMTSRWHFSDPAAYAAPGLRNAGIIGMLPLSSEVLAVLYDGDVYAISHQAGWIDLTAADDAEAFNEHQVLNCEANLYFRNWSDEPAVAALASRVSPSRPPARHRIEHAVLEREDAEGKVFRVVSAEEARGRPGMVHTELVLAEPSKWPSQLAWRAGGYVFATTTAEGFVRKQQRELGGGPYKKTRLR
jgi:hypothetical protein